MALWGGRFEKGVDAFTQEFGASLEVDKNMAAQDIAGSRAHARMLAEQGIISPEDQAAIDAGLADIAKQIEEGTFVWDVNDEDVHMAVEGALTRAIGAAGGRLHTGRSRNDQVATDIRLLSKDLCNQLMAGNVALRRVLLDVADKNLDVVMPGYTHLQHAQPVLLSHHLLAPQVNHAHLAVLHNLDIHNGKVCPDPFHMLAALVILPVQLIPLRPPVILAFQQKRLPVQQLHRFLDPQLLLRRKCFKIIDHVFFLSVFFSKVRRG